MGSILSRRIAGVEDIDIQANSAYRFPPKSGEWLWRRLELGFEHPQILKGERSVYVFIYFESRDDVLRSSGGELLSIFPGVSASVFTGQKHFSTDKVL